VRIPRIQTDAGYGICEGSHNIHANPSLKKQTYQTSLSDQFLRSASPHLAHELLPVDLGRAVGFQLDVGPTGPSPSTGPSRGGRHGWLRVRGVLGLVIGPLDPVAPELGQQDEGEGTPTTQNLFRRTARTR